MTRRLVLTYLSVAAFVLVILEVPLGVNFARTETDRLAVDLERDAVVIASRVEDALQAGVVQGIDPGLGGYPDDTGARIVITDADGVSVWDSDRPDERRDFSTRPEIADAMNGRRAVGTRPSETLGTDLLYVAVPVASGGAVHGTVRITLPTDQLQARVRRNWLLLGTIAVIVLVMTAVVAVALARWVTRPTRHLTAAVEDIARGDLDRRVPDDEGPPEVRELARNVNDMAARLGELLASQRAFVADASHQLRSPLTALRLELETLELAAEPEVAEGIQRAVDETNRLSRLVDGLLMLARTEGTRPEARPIDVAAVARDRVAAWRVVAEDGDVDLVLVAPGVDGASHGETVAGRSEAEGSGAGTSRAPGTGGGTGVGAWVVPGHLEQILDNLVSNAIEAVARGGRIVVRVVPGADTRHGDVQVRVEDDGPGMPKADRDRALDRFWRGGSTDAGRGSGLGLPIARQLARASGGDLWLDSNEPRGLVVVVSLPDAASAHPSERSVLSTEDEAPDEQRGSEQRRGRGQHPTGGRGQVGQPRP